MNNVGKWIYRILTMLLAVLLIDFDCNSMRPTAEKSHYILLTNLVLGGLLLLLLISQLKKRRP